MGAHDLWSRWNADPLVVLSLVAAASLYHRGTVRRRSMGDRLRSRCFWAAVVTVTVALVSPLDLLAVELASAHMVQHILLVLVAAPLLAVSAPAATILVGGPGPVRRIAGRVSRRLRSARRVVDVLRNPTLAWLLHAGTLWFWHASVPYDAALDHPFVHAIEHGSFLGTGVLFWSAVLHPRAVRRVARGHGALLVFTMAMQSVFLAALLTFATTPWYEGYRESTSAWGLTPLADQQLAGVIMWVPAGLVYVAVGVLLVAAWVRDPPLMGSGAVDEEWPTGSAPDVVTPGSRVST